MDRDLRSMDIDVDSLVVGDVIYCTEGQRIPADAIIIDSQHHVDN